MLDLPTLGGDNGDDWKRQNTYLTKPWLTLDTTEPPGLLRKRPRFLRRARRAAASQQPVHRRGPAGCGGVEPPIR